ncbi:MAG: hypothetical protein WCX73_04985 [Candidatus Pacearchaeota archaeon]|jgi:hypothetical protein
MKVKIISIFKKEEEINKIINKIKNYSFDDFSKHKHFEFSVMEKATDEKMLRETFPRFKLIKTIELRENEKKEKHYSFNYELQDGTFVIIALALNKEPLMIINAYHKNTNYKQFEKSLRKNYRKKFI